MYRILISLLLVSSSLLFSININAADQFPVAAPMNTELAGATASIAIPSVYRVVCSSTKHSGTSFLHKSGYIITANHVIEGCEPKDISLIDTTAQVYKISKIISDADIDIALLLPKKKMNAPCLSLSNWK